MATTPSALDERFCYETRVYWEDTDAGGVVYHASYLRFMERARTEWLRAKGYEQRALAQSHHVFFVATSLQIDFVASARLDDQVRVSVALAECRRVTFSVRQRVLCRDVELARAEVELACLDVERSRPIAMPPELRAAIVGERANAGGKSTLLANGR